MSRPLQVFLLVFVFPNLLIATLVSVGNYRTNRRLDRDLKRRLDQQTPRYVADRMQAQFEHELNNWTE